MKDVVLPAPDGAVRVLYSRERGEITLSFHSSAPQETLSAVDGIRFKVDFLASKEPTAAAWLVGTAVLAALEATMLASLQKKGAGEFSIPGLVRVAAIQVPAKKARKGINPFTKEEQIFKAKPATVKLRATFFKKLKDAAL